MSDLIDNLIEATNQGKLLDALSEARQQDNVSHEDLSAALVRINVDHSIDVIGQFRNLKNADGSHQFFDLRWLLEAALAEMNCPAEEVMRCVLHLTSEAGQDMTAERLFDPFTDFCSKSTTRPEESLNLIANDKGLQDLLSPALVAGSRLDLALYHGRAVELTQDPDLEIRRRSINALGQLNYGEDTSLVEKSVVTLGDAVAQETDDLLIGNAVKATFSLYLKKKELAGDLVRIVSRALECGAEYTLHAASELIAFYAENLPEEIFPLLLKYLAAVDPGNGGTIQNISFGISSLLKMDDPSDGVTLLEDLLLANNGATTIDALIGVQSTITQSSDKLLDTLATRWFSDGNKFLCQAISRIVELEYRNTPALSVDPDQLSDIDLTHIYFICRKAIGFLFLYPVTAASFVLSLTELAQDSQTQAALTELLFDPMMLSYPRALKTAFEPILSQEVDGPSKTACKEVSERFDAYIFDIKSVGEILEHHPPQSHQELHIRKFTREMSEAMKEAEANSVLLSMVKKSVLLYGRKWVTYVDHPGQPANRMESSLQSVETSVDMPRMQNIDPLGLDYMLRVFRVEQLKK